MDAEISDTGDGVWELEEVSGDSSGNREVTVVNNPSVVVITTTPETILSVPISVKVNVVVYREQIGHEFETTSGWVVEEEDSTRKVTCDELCS